MGASPPAPARGSTIRQYCGSSTFRWLPQGLCPGEWTGDDGPGADFPPPAGRITTKIYDPPLAHPLTPKNSLMADRFLKNGSWTPPRLRESLQRPIKKPRGPPGAPPPKAR